MILDRLHMYVMDSRYLQLERTLRALREDGIALVMNTDGAYGASGFTDDVGLYYFVPKLALAFHLTVQQSLNLFLASLIALAWAAGTAGFCRLFRKPAARAVAAVGLLLLARIAYQFSDVYVCQMFMAAAFAPWFLYAVERGGKRALLVTAFLAGFVGGYSNLIRSQSGTVLFLFGLLFVLLSKRPSGGLKALAAAVLCLGVAVPTAHFHRLETRRDAFLVSKVPGYRPGAVRHPLWHSIYIGFGYLPNPYGLAYSDTCAADQVASVDKTIAYCSPEYDAALRRATVDFVRAHPAFALETILKKAARLIGFLILFGNIGWLFLARLKPGWRKIFPFFAAMAFGALPGLLVIPSKSYVLGMIGITVVFGIYLIGLGLEQNSNPNNG